MTPILLALTAVALQVVPAPARPQAQPSLQAMDPFGPDTVLVASASPRVVLVSSVDGGVAALRLSVPLEEAPVEAGAGQILVRLALARMEGLAGPVGARVGATRTPWGLVYTVEGAAADLEYLAYLLRQAAAEPAEAEVALEAARSALAEEVARAAETPAGRLVEDLRRAVAPHLPSINGTAGTVAALDAARIRNVWRRTHRPGAMTLVIAAAVVPEVVLASVRGLGAADGTTASPPDAPAPPDPTRTRPQSLRTWYGEAWGAGPPSDPRATVGALLLAEVVEGSADGFEAGVQLQALRDRWLIVVAGAAYGADRGRMRQAVSGALEETRRRLTEASVRHAVDQALRELLFAARTPSGLVARIGRDLEVTDAPDGATRYLEALSSIDLAAMQAFFDGLIQNGAATAEVRP